MTVTQWPFHHFIVERHFNRYDAAKEMTCHFFGVKQLTVDQDQRLRSIFDDDRPSLGDSVSRKITLAEVEQLAGEFDTVDDFIVALEDI